MIQEQWTFGEARLHNGMQLYGINEDTTLFQVIKDTGRWQGETEDLLHKYIQQGDTVIDIGANIGYFTCIMAELVGSYGAVYSFEPAPTYYKLLRKAVEFNNLTNVVTIPFGLGDKRQDLPMFYSLNNPGHSGMTDDASNCDTIVKVDRLDNIISENTHVDFIKMDIEGFEGLAFRGMQRILKNYKPTIVFEVTPPDLEKYGTPAIEVLSNLESFGYRFSYPCMGGQSQTAEQALAAAKSVFDTGNCVDFLASTKI